MLGYEQVVAARLVRNELGAAEREAADEDPEAREELLLFGVEELVAPFDRAAQRPVSLGQAGAWRCPQEIEARVETFAQRTWREDVASRRGKLERQRKTVQADADLDDRLGVRVRELEVGSGRASPIDEQPDRLGPAQPGNRGTPRRIGQLEGRHPVD